jgi:tetratricopeptide (TPR) repeat protein
MSGLTEQEILDLLEQMDPDEILAAKSEQLDEAGKNLLEELRQDIQSGQDVFAAYGRQFREADAAERKSPPKTPGQGKVIWLRRSIKLPHWFLAAAALVVAVIFLPRFWDESNLGQTRSGSRNLREIEKINEELVEVLVKRGTLLLDAGNQEGKRAYYEEARNDLMQAYELDPENAELLALLARIYEKLGQDGKAQKFFEEWQAAHTALEHKE